jgi:hypothetical protein
MQKRRKWAAFLETLGQRRATINKVYSKQNVFSRRVPANRRKATLLAREAMFADVRLVRCRD